MCSMTAVFCGPQPGEIIMKNHVERPDGREALLESYPRTTPLELT